MASQLGISRIQCCEACGRLVAIYCLLGVGEQALRVALLIRRLNELTEDLDAAMETRSVINISCGVIIAQKGCTLDEAIAILRNASSDRNQKLRDLARDLVTGVSRSQNIRREWRGLSFRSSRAHRMQVSSNDGGLNASLL